MHASYVASLIESAPIRVSHPQTPYIQRYIRRARPALKIFTRNLPPNFQPEGSAITQNYPNGLGLFEPQVLAERRERKYQILSQAYRESSAYTL